MVDPLSEKYMSMSPYHFSGNNPIVNVDDNGKDYSVYFEQDDDGNLQVRITATYYVEDCDEESYKSAKAGADHWNNQSGKYALIVKDEDGNKSSYSIVFDINVYQVMNPEMERKKDTNNAEDAITPDGSSNLFNVVKPTEIKSPYARGENSGMFNIKVPNDDKEVKVASHEQGHTMGLEDKTSGIMGGSEDISISRWDVRDIINFAIKTIKEYPTNHKVSVIGKIPKGKVKPNPSIQNGN